VRLAKKNARSELSISREEWRRHAAADSSVLDTSPIFSLENQPYLVPRVHASQVSVQDFIQRFERPRKPVIIQGLLGEWPASAAWTPEKLLQKFPDTRFKVGSDDDGYPVRMKLKHYLMYISDAVHSQDDSPLYIFDGAFTEKRCARHMKQVCLAMRCYTAALTPTLPLLCNERGGSASTVAALNIEPWCNIYCLYSLSLRVWRVQFMGGMNWKRPTAIEGTMEHGKTSFSTKIFDGAIISVAQYLVPLR
jgi:hypothetical protein